MDSMKTHLTDAGASKVAFAECRDEARRLLPKVICFSHHSESVSLRNFVRLLPKIDIGLPQLVKTTLDARRQEPRCRPSQAVLLSRGVHQGHGDDETRRPPVRSTPVRRGAASAPQAHMSTRPLHSVAAATKKTEKVEHGNLLFASQNSIFAVRVAGKTQQCRAHLKGRCNMGATCFESHDTPESEITCCSKLAKDDPPRFPPDPPHVPR